MQQVRAKKFLGQHFLKDLSVAQRIAETITAGRVLEIGPGMGVLTQYLLKNPNLQTTAIEIDRESVAYLKEWYPELHLIEGDFLKLDLNIIYPDGDFCVIGNYPYNISSQIFFKVLDNKDRIPICSGMIQKEVAERIANVHTFKMQDGKPVYALTASDAKPNYIMARRAQKSLKGFVDLYYAGIVRYRDHGVRARFLQALSLFGVR